MATLFVFVVFAVCAANACPQTSYFESTKTPCGAVSTDGTAPSVTYSHAASSLGEYSFGTIATLSCTDIGVSTLLATGSSSTSDAFDQVVSLTCLPDGRWSTDATWQCLSGCRTLRSDRPSRTAISYSGSNRNGLYLPSSTASVNCRESANRGSGENSDLFNQDTFALGADSTTAVSLTCTNGNWLDSNSNAVTAVNCYQKCAKAGLPLIGYDVTTFTGLTGEIRHGETLNQVILSATAAATTPCGALGTLDIKVDTITQTIAAAEYTHGFTCYDGVWQTTVDDGTDVQQGDVVSLTCSA